MGNIVITFKGKSKVYTKTPNPLCFIVEVTATCEHYIVTIYLEEDNQDCNNKRTPEHGQVSGNRNTLCVYRDEGPKSVV